MMADERDVLGRLLPSSRGRGTCRKCGRDDILINSNGTLRYHYAPLGHHPQGSCSGSRKLPAGRITTAAAAPIRAAIRAYALALPEQQEPGYGLGRIRDDLLAILDRQEGAGQ
jgi:hypothetical protein